MLAPLESRLVFVSLLLVGVTWRLGFSVSLLQKISYASI